MKPLAAAASALALAAALLALARSAPAREEAARPREAAAPAVPRREPAPIRLLPPLPPDLPATASFGEYRTGHLHAGLDFSTRGEIGWPVRAAADGEVYRLKVERRGYGRALYLRHAGGYETVYGHLFAFDDEALGLERFVAAERARRGDRYPGDLAVDPPVKVRAGQAIGLSGERGGGLPHLHFELRHDGEPVDPLRYGGLDPLGFGAPVLGSLRLVPRGPLRVNGAWGPASLPLTRARAEGAAPSRYRLAGVPVVEGAFDLEVDAKVDGSGAMGVAGLALACAGETAFRADLHRFSFEQYRESGLLLDAAESRSSPARFVYRLRAPAGMTIPGIAGDGVGARPPGRLACALAAESAKGARAVADLAFEIRPAPPFGAPPAAPPKSWRLFDGMLLLDGKEAVPAEPAGARPGLPVLVEPRGEPIALPGGASITFPEDAFFSPRPIAVAGEPSAPHAAGLETVIAPFRLGPDDLFLRRPAVLRASVADPVRTSFYWRDPATGGWEALGKEVRGGAIESETRGAGVFAALRDAIPPRITGAQVRLEPRLGLRRLVLPVAETGEGIEVDGCRVALDAAPAEPEYDPDRGWVEVWLPKGASGKRAVTATCRDRAGNESKPFVATVAIRPGKGNR